MLDVSAQRIGELLRGIIETLWNRPDGRYAREVIDHLPEIIRLTTHEMGMSSTANMPQYERTARFATLPLIQIGWIAKTNKGVWLLTEEGRAACRRFQNPQELFLAATHLAEDTRRSTSELIISFDAIQEKAWEITTNFIAEKNTVEIRKLISSLLEAMDFHPTWVAHPQKDHGLIDIIAITDPIGLKSYRILVHIKHAGQPVTVEGLKSFLSILGSNDFGLFFSTGGFTTEAQNEIVKGGFQKINAMDLQKFYDLWIKHYDKLSLNAHQILPLKAVYIISPPE